ncbi:YeeE/YedE family protein [Knoellia sp. 3-2P3]|uniref:YeeE/YedE family protein n=1 Tax=unclassified Knoellia TaxID=2618719 RepID=UPI0023DCD108|nr:YeeE/YedE family protein [Knoellia sp. 3-2P3]MDF2090865.1 YeeE/YedE family protein [Knoellia sp. 3-2P3]
MALLTGVADALSTERRPAPEPPTAPPAKRVPLAAGLALAVTLAGAVAATAGLRLTLLFVVGLALGVALFNSRFGFTSAWRQLVAVGQGRALQAHMLMLAAACLLFAPLLAAGTGFRGVEIEGSLSPVGTSLLVGAFLFGIGMQIGGSCASGTLFAIGSGQTAIVLTLAGFIAGSVLGAWHLPFWTTQMPTGPEVSFADTPLGYPGAVLISLTLMALVVGATVVVGRRRQPPALDRPPVARGVARVIRGSWPIWVGAMVLAGLNALTLWLSGGAWGVTSAFALWGSKALDAVGVDVASWGYWQNPGNAEKLAGPVLADRTSVMNVGIMVGALIASAAAGAFTLHRRIPGKLAAGAVIGGILMGYGARLAYGCNIGAYFGGIASFSLHGWVWGAVAILGTVVGLRARPLFGLGNPKPTDSAC